MGDSNTYGLYLKPEESYPIQLQAIWNEHHPDQPMEVINLGYPGANSSRIISNLQDALNTLQPDVVLIMIGTNDFWTLPISTANRDLANNQPSITAWIKVHSRTYRLYCLLKRQPFEQNALRVTTTSDPAQITSAQGKDPAIDYKNLHLDFSIKMRGQNDNFDANKNLLDNLTQLMTAPKQHQYRVIFITYPANKGYYKQANKLMHTAVRQNSYADFIDLIPTFSTLQPGKGQTNDYFFTDLHATAAGNHLVAQEVMHGLEVLLQTTHPKIEPHTKPAEPIH